jgi:hypothetical protein
MTVLTNADLGELSATNLANQAGFSRSTAQRFLEALEKHTRIGIHFTTWERLCAVLGKEVMNAFAPLLRLTDNGPGAGVSHSSSGQTKNECEPCNKCRLIQDRPGPCINC